MPPDDETVSDTLMENFNNLSAGSAGDRIIARITIKKGCIDKMYYPDGSRSHSDRCQRRQFLSRSQESIFVATPPERTGCDCVVAKRESGLTLGISIVQGTDNNVYVKDLVRHGPGELSGVQIGDQV